MKYPFAITLAIFLLLIGVLSEDARVKILYKWPSGFYRIVEFQLQAEVEDGWRVKVTFWKPVKSFLVWRASVESISEDKGMFILQIKTWNSEMPAGRLFRFRFLGKKMRFGKMVPKITATFIRIGEWLWRWFLKREPNESNIMFCLEIAVEYLSKHFIVISVHWTSSKCKARTSIRCFISWLT